MFRLPGVWVSLFTICATAIAAQAQGPISIRVLQGDNAINSIRLRRGHDPVVQVFDSTGEPLPRATVSFLLPATGASATFGDSGLSLTVQTDEHGMAAGRGLVPNRTEGPFHIRVTASFQGEAASASLSQTNAEAVAKSSRSKWIALAAVIGGAAAGGVVMASRGGKSSTPAPPGGTTGGTTGATGTIVPGSPSFGPPK
jgi:hypothetical protein